ncbi:Kruppel-like factor 18 [Microtus ochrogaster]|uniref:Kruppel-like factor 18 n=1 Tax=Microtus ochrogaster TaxID=79684 RepID=A0ABM1U6W1_MICOH|nr:Kruppel-like factor 18 [Microtus ochrogaster]
MFSDSGTAEQTEEPQQVISKPCQDQGETPGDSEPGPSTSQSAPVTMSMLESILRYGMASGYQPTTMGEPRGSFAFSQKDMSADQTKSPARSQLMKLKDQETSLTDSQERAVSDSEETVYKECRYVKVPFGKETFVFQPTPLCGSQRNSPGDSQGTHSEGQLVPLEGGRVRSFSAKQTWGEDHEVPSILDLTVKKDQQMPVTGEKTVKCSQIATRVGEPFLYEGKMAAPSYSQALHPSELISSFSFHTSCQYEKMVLSRDKDLFRDHLVSIKGYKAFYKHQTRDLSSTQINHYGQLVSSRGQNVSTGQGTVPSVEECRRRQTFNPPLYSRGPLAPRPPPESASVSANVLGQLHQYSSFIETKSHDSQKTHIWKPYFCPYDDGETSFPMSSLLRDHRRTHTGELPYACDHPQCGLKFLCLDNLLSHRREHMEEQPYRCSYCNQGFTRLDDLRMHSSQHFSTLS